MIEQDLLTISVFKYESMTECLDSYESHGKIYEIEYDLLNDDDWWYPYAHEAEYKFGSKWSLILIKIKDGLRARFIDRNYFLNGEINNNSFAYTDKLFLIGKSSSKNLNVYFSNHIIFNYKLDEIKSVKYYQKGYDETLISLINVFTSVMYDEAKIIDVIYNPMPQSIMMMKLSDHYKFMIHIPTKDKVNELIGLHNALLFTTNIYHQMLQARKITNCYGTTELKFMIPLIAEIENKIFPNLISCDSFYKIFEEKFIIKF